MENPADTICDAEELGSKIRAINVTLYDFEDYVEPETYEKAKFTELETATRDLALTLVDHITTFTTQSALDPLPASKFPALPPLPPLPPLPNTSRPDSRMTSRTAPNGSTAATMQRRPSEGTRSEGRDEYSRQAQGRSAAYSDSMSPVSPTGPPLPLSQHLMAEQDRMRNDYFKRTHRQRPSNSNNNSLPMLMDRMDIGNVTPPSSVIPSQGSSGYRSPIATKGRGPSMYPYHDTPPASDIAEQQEFPFGLDPPNSHAYMSPTPTDSHSSMAEEHSPQRHFDARPEPPTELLQRDSLATQMYSYSERSGGSHEPLRSSAVSITSSTEKTGDSVSGKSINRSSMNMTGNEIRTHSTINALGGFCKGARNFASAGPGRAIKRVGAMEGQGSGSGPNNQDFSQEMLFGSMLGATGASTASDPTAQCQSCDYKTLYSILRQDIEQDREFPRPSSYRT